ncbi:efflux RND transporter periplasmic adaptor subunit [Stappia taiwanensis]|uniref:Efflux RND transporter periplasmic adaptor subunit n=1 Tax=Stappia taiwanensis TaxID=992267 RepID=A0A838Y1L9_9HYPH|nr:efflux RND transporter periplasmic adaptor subunit [Stappia taiwanensis]MBA4612840.1 efflux RND transporter periplasmic adaptor subunit [Stappia taiwanensis]GGE89586.1 RND transporter [Stappia taiwanensis]
MTKRRVSTLIGVLLLAGLVTGAYLFVQHRPLSVPVVAQETNVDIRVFGLGTVEARVVSEIGFEVSAALTELRADHGDAVSKGAVLARLQDSEQQARVRRAEAAVLAASVTIRKAEANVDRAHSVLEQTRQVNQRRKALVGSNVVSQQQADESQRDEEVAAAELSVARSEVEVAKAQLADAEAALSYERTVLGQHTLTAPFDAVIVRRHREPGAVVREGEAIFTLMAPETVWTLAYVDEARAGAIELGQSAEVRLRSLPHDVFPAKVARIGIESDRVNEERRVWVSCQQCPPRAFLGEQAEVRITVARLDTALMVPEAAVAGFDGHTGRVWTVEDGRFQRRALVFGHRSEDARLEVTGGLPEGARIVSAAVSGLREGRMARVSDGAAP